MKNKNNIISRLQSYPDCLESLCASTDMDMERAQEKLEIYHTLLIEWNRFASLLSQGDAENHIIDHIIDGLSLVPVLSSLDPQRVHLLDIGSGGGFPAIPIKIMLPNLRMTLMERSQRKAGFLLKAVSMLQLDEVDVLSAVYPNQHPDRMPDVVTARAVEKPGLVIPEILDRLQPGSVFLNQSGLSSDESDSRFHVEHIEDVWTRKGLRRGSLSVVRCIQAQ